MDKYLKAVFDLKNRYGKKLVEVLYYVGIIVAFGDLIYNVINSVFVMSLGGASIFEGIWSFLTAPVVFVFYIIIIRVFCEVLNIFFDRYGDNSRE